jgi:hypothetical protein
LTLPSARGTGVALLFVAHSIEPVAWPALGMRHGEDPDVFAEVHEDQRVREAREQGATDHQVCRQIE